MGGGLYRFLSASLGGFSGGGAGAGALELGSGLPGESLGFVVSGVGEAKVVRVSEAGMRGKEAVEKM